MVIPFLCLAEANAASELQVQQTASHSYSMLISTGPSVLIFHLGDKCTKPFWIKSTLFVRYPTGALCLIYSDKLLK